MMDSRRRLSLVYRIMGWELVLVWASSASEILCWTRGNAAPTSYHHRRANQFWILPGRTWTSCWKGRMLRPNSLSKTKRNCKNIWTLPWSLKRICLVILNTAIQPCVRSTTWRIARQKIAVLAKTRRPTLKTILACTTRQLKTLRMPIPNAIQQQQWIRSILSTMQKRRSQLKVQTMINQSIIHPKLKDFLLRSHIKTKYFKHLVLQIRSSKCGWMRPWAMLSTWTSQASSWSRSTRTRSRDMASTG